MRGLRFLADQYYHIYNRGVEKRAIFLDRHDYFRFLYSLQEMNREGWVYNIGAKLQLKGLQAEANDSAMLVRIVCYCLMPNHFHLILRSCTEDGLPKFMHKIGTGYTNYFNKRYERTGALFQGTYKAKHIENDSYLLQLSRYLHLNPTDLEDKLGDKLSFARGYHWSSYRAYLKLKHRDIVRLDREIITSQFSDLAGYGNFVESGSIGA